MRRGENRSPRVPVAFVKIAGASPKGTCVRLRQFPAEGMGVRGAQGIDVGDSVRVRLASVDVAKDFIDFERKQGVSANGKSEIARQHARLESGSRWVRAHSGTAPPERRLQAAATTQTTLLPRKRGVPILLQAQYRGQCQDAPVGCCC